MRYKIKENDVVKRTVIIPRKINPLLGFIGNIFYLNAMAVCKPILPMSYNAFVQEVVLFKSMSKL